MAWITENRRTAVIEKRGEPYLTEELKQQIAAKYFPRYPTKRAVLLPALHAIQHRYNWIPMQAMEEVAEFLELAPADVLDTASFYEEYWLKPKGKFLIQVCRSLSCEVCGSRGLTEHCKQKYGLELGETTPDGRFTLVELECLGACGTAPVALVNEVLYEELTTENFDRILESLPRDPHEHNDPFINWNEEDEDHGHAVAEPTTSANPAMREGIDRISHGGAEGKEMN
jgi:NADH-quinone oxidoreductase subunit E